MASRVILADRMAAEARSLVATPWQHLGRTPGVGLDCLGLLIVVARRCDVLPPDFDVVNYGRFPSPEELRAGIEKHADPVGVAAAPGRVGLFAVAGRAQHVGLFVARPDGGLDLVHAYATAKAVVAHRFASPWTRRLRCVFEMRPCGCEARR